LGLAYWRGRGAPQSYSIAAYQFNRVAEQGHIKAQYNVGVAYWHGQGVPQSYAIAMYWFTLAARQGSALAHSALATAYRRGLGVPRSCVFSDRYFSEEQAPDTIVQLMDAIDQDPIALPPAVQPSLHNSSGGATVIRISARTV